MMSLPKEILSNSLNHARNLMEGDRRFFTSLTSTYPSSNHSMHFRKDGASSRETSLQSNKQSAVSEISSLLSNVGSSGSELQTLEGVKKAIIAYCLGIDVSSVLPCVLQGIVSSDTHLKRLVYVFLTHYAEKCSDVALLSVSHLQKELQDRSPYHRALSIRVLCSLRVSILIPIMILAVTKASGDVSSYVRQTAAWSIAKIVALIAEGDGPDTAATHRPAGDGSSSACGALMDESDPDVVELLRILALLMDDTRPIVVGGALAAFHRISMYVAIEFKQSAQHIQVEDDDATTRTNGKRPADVSMKDPYPPVMMQMLHRNFRKICSLLNVISEWHVLPVLGVLKRYARSQFRSPDQRALHYTLPVHRSGQKEKRGFYSSSSSSSSSSSCDHQGIEKDGEHGNHHVASSASSRAPPHHELDVDHRRLLRAVHPLLASPNSALVLEACSVIFSLAPSSEFDARCVKSLLRLLYPPAADTALIIISTTGTTTAASGAVLPSVRSYGTTFVVLTNILTLVRQRSTPWVPHIDAFRINVLEPAYIWKLKAAILVELIRPENAASVVPEIFQVYMNSTGCLELVRTALQMVAQIAKRDPAVILRSPHLPKLFEMLCHEDSDVAADCVLAIQTLFPLVDGVGGRGGNIEGCKDKTSKSLARIMDQLVEALMNNGKNIDGAQGGGTTSVQSNDTSMSSLRNWKMRPVAVVSILSLVEDRMARHSRVLQHVPRILQHFLTRLLELDPADVSVSTETSATRFKDAPTKSVGGRFVTQPLHPQEKLQTLTLCFKFLLILHEKKNFPIEAQATEGKNRAPSNPTAATSTLTVSSRAVCHGSTAYMIPNAAQLLPRVECWLRAALDKCLYDLDMDVRLKTRLLLALLDPIPSDDGALSTGNDDPAENRPGVQGNTLPSALPETVYAWLQHSRTAHQCEPEPPERGVMMATHSDAPSSFTTETTAHTKIPRNADPSCYGMEGRPSLKSGVMATDPRQAFMLGSLSHLSAKPLCGYMPLAPFRTRPSDPSVRESTPCDRASAWKPLNGQAKDPSSYAHRSVSSDAHSSDETTSARSTSNMSSEMESYTYSTDEDEKERKSPLQHEFSGTSSSSGDSEKQAWSTYTSDD